MPPFRGQQQLVATEAHPTLTTIVVFLAHCFIHGASGELFKDQAWTVAFSLLSSLFVAIFVIPALYHRFYKTKQHLLKNTLFMLADTDGKNIKTEMDCCPFDNYSSYRLIYACSLYRH